MVKMASWTTLSIAVLAYGLIAMTATEAHMLSWTSHTATAKNSKQPGKAFMDMMVVRDHMPASESWIPTHHFNGELRLKNMANVVAVYLRMGDSTETGAVALKLWPVSGSANAQPLTVAGQVTIPFRIQHDGKKKNKLSTDAGDIEAFISSLSQGKVYLSVVTKDPSTGLAGPEFRGQTKLASETYCAGLPGGMIPDYAPECAPKP